MWSIVSVCRGFVVLGVAQIDASIDASARAGSFRVVDEPPADDDWYANVLGSTVAIAYCCRTPARCSRCSSPTCARRTLGALVAERYRRGAESVRYEWILPSRTLPS